ncbi:MAG: GTP-binding protein, partial [Proteobacteria bacterium]|nr:GTP-binding protein [Pseudomonadota bacterium]
MSNANPESQVIWNPLKSEKSAKTTTNSTRSAPPLASEEDPNPPPINTEKIPNPPKKIITIAVLGRPNVGKSTLINALLGQEKMLTGPTAGLTREAISHPFEYQDETLMLVDTPGLRRKNRIDEDDIEFLSVGQSLQAAEKADVVVLVVDASQHNLQTGKWQVLEQQDAHIAQMVLNQFKPLVICLNKWDAVANKTACLADVEVQLKHRMHTVTHPLALPTSAKNNKGLVNLLDAVIQVNIAKAATFSTGKLNNLLNKTLAKRSPPLANGKTVSLKFIRQTGSNPPIFTFWGNRIDQVSNDYQQFLKHQLAETLGLQNIPIRIFFRAQKNPYKGQKFKKK